MISGFFGKYRFLSNFWPCDIIYEGIRYPSSEHAYQAAKTLDESIRLEISKLSTPGETKRFARKIKLRDDWEQKKVSIMTKIVRIKFNYNNDLCEMLKDTGEEKLVEENTWGDRFWGVCNGTGENHLGKILMKIRSEL